MAVKILDSQGNPMKASSFTGANRARELACWNPRLKSADADLIPERDKLVARSRDIVRNHATATSGLETHIDNVIGKGLKLSAKPDFKGLGLSADWANEFSEKAENAFRVWAEDVDYYCDAARKSNFDGLQVQAYKSSLWNGEILALSLWFPNRGGQYATAIQMIEPDRLCNPRGKPNSKTLRDGVEFDQYGSPVAYHIRTTHQTDSMFGQREEKWTRIPRYTPWGRARVIHIFENERPGQTRGRPLFTPILKKLKMLDMYQGAELETAIIQTLYAAVIESEYDTISAMQALGAHQYDDDSTTALQQQLTASYMKTHLDYHDGAEIELNGSKVVHLMPHEKLKFMTSNQAHNGFKDFEESILRHCAAGLGVTYEQISKDYSKVSYSSARAAMRDAWKHFERKRSNVAAKFATQCYALVLEEIFDKGLVPIPQGAAGYYDAKTEYTRCRWIGPGKGYVDPLKERKAAQLGIQMGVTTLEDECAEQGKDYIEVLEQRAREKAKMEELGLTPMDLAFAFNTEEETNETPTNTNI